MAHIRATDTLGENTVEGMNVATWFSSSRLYLKCTGWAFHETSKSLHPVKVFTMEIRALRPFPSACLLVLYSPVAKNGTSQRNICCSISHSTMFMNTVWVSVSVQAEWGGQHEAISVCSFSKLRSVPGFASVKPLLKVFVFPYNYN